MIWLGVGIAVVAIAGGIGLLAWRRRLPPSVEKGIGHFQRGLDALDPANDPLTRSKKR